MKRIVALTCLALLAAVFGGCSAGVTGMVPAVQSQSAQQADTLGGGPLRSDSLGGGPLRDKGNDSLGGGPLRGPGGK